MFTDDRQQLTIEAKCDEQVKLNIDCEKTVCSYTIIADNKGQYFLLQITAEDIDFWKYHPSQHDLLSDKNVYPPTISYSAYSDASIRALMAFEVKHSKSQPFLVNVTWEFNCQSKLVWYIAKDALSL